MSEYSDRERSAGARWFFVAGAAAITLAFTLWYVDERVSHSPSEKLLGEKLHQLRSAQSSLASEVSDERQLRTVKGNDSTLDGYVFKEGSKDHH
jgi:hypothetical protein